MATHVCTVFGVAVAAFLAGILPLPSNIHWLHLLATYPTVDGYVASSMMGSALKLYFASSVENFQGVCKQEPQPCGAGGAIESATIDWPCSIQGAFDSERAVDAILQHFAGEYQNQFLPCEEEEPLAFGWEAKPCLNITFTERIRRLDPHHSLSKGWQVFTKVLTAGDVATEQDMLVKALGTAPELTRLLEHSSIWPHVSVFMNRNESAVPYFHAHPDYFVVWNVVGMKEWLMLPPAFLPQTEAVWSGLSFMALVEPETSCAVRVVLEPGDVLIVPSWWLHQTRLLDDHKGKTHSYLRHLGYSQHFALKSSIGGQLLSLSEKMFGPSFGYQYFDMFAPSRTYMHAVENRFGFNASSH